MRISAYADHPHEPHGSATAWPSLVPLYLWPFAMPGLEEDVAGGDHDPGWFSGKEFKRKLRPQILPNYAKLPSSITQSKNHAM